MHDGYEIDNEHDLIEALRDQSVMGYDFEVKFTDVRDTKGVIWPVIEVSNVSYPGGVPGLEGQFWFWEDGKVMQVL